MKKFHDALKTIYGPKRSGATPLFSADGSTLLTDKATILKRWAEIFNSVHNRPSSVIDNATNRLPQIECNILLGEFPNVMAPTLFSMMFSAMLTDAFQDVDAGFPIRCRFDGK